MKLVSYLLQQGHHRILQPDGPQPHTLATFKNSCTIVKLLLQYGVQAKTSEPLLQVLKQQCVRCITAYKSLVNEPFQGTMPLEYSIRCCDMIVIKTMF